MLATRILFSICKFEQDLYILPMNLTHQYCLPYELKSLAQSILSWMRMSPVVIFKSRW